MSPNTVPNVLQAFGPSLLFGSSWVSFPLLFLVSLFLSAPLEPVSHPLISSPPVGEGMGGHFPQWLLQLLLRCRPLRAHMQLWDQTKDREDLFFFNLSGFSECSWVRWFFSSEAYYLAKFGWRVFTGKQHIPDSQAKILPHFKFFFQSLGAWRKGHQISRNTGGKISAYFLPAKWSATT